jgi:Nuclear pore assembly and biogenesis
MDFLHSAQTFLRRTTPSRSSETISTIADQIVNFLMPSSSPSSSSTFTILQRDYIDPYIISPLQTLLTSASATSSSSRSVQSSSGIPDIISLLALVVIAFISFKVLDYVRRVVMWWVMLALKLCLILVAVQVGWYVSKYGWEKTLNDAGWAWGLLEGFLAETGAQMRGNTRSRTATTGARGYGRQQAPLGNTRGQKGRWT